VACGEVGLAGLRTTATCPGVAAAVGCVTTGADGTADGCADEAGDGATDGAGGWPSPGLPDGRGAAGVGFTAGAVADDVGPAAPGSVGVVVAMAVPDVGTAPTSDV
jgi:hypothetical protein